MDNLERLAIKLVEMYKANRNPPSTAPRVGKVIKIDPLEIQWGDSIILKSDKLFLPRGLVFELSDKVTIIPDEHLKMFFVINILA
jgi:signal peptidase I